MREKKIERRKENKKELRNRKCERRKSELKEGERTFEMKQKMRGSITYRDATH